MLCILLYPFLGEKSGFYETINSQGKFTQYFEELRDIIFHRRFIICLLCLKVIHEKNLYQCLIRGYFFLKDICDRKAKSLLIWLFIRFDKYRYLFLC